LGCTIVVFFDAKLVQHRVAKGVCTEHKMKINGNRP
jgi:hypothetical protein